MQLEGYKIGSALGDGGMATVYKGEQESLQRPVAIKVLKSKLLNHEEIRKRFERESIIIARLSHPNIIHVIDQGITHDGMPYFVMEYVKSINLKVAMEKGNMSLSRALDIFTQIAKALAYAHKNRIIHCDIKPENVLVDFEGNVRVLDFGIAQMFEDMESNSEDGKGYVMGSEKYMAPEQHRSITEATEKSDLFSLGVMMYLFFTKHYPTGNYPPVSKLNSNIPQPLDDLIMQCLQEAPERRPESADNVKNRLLKVLQGGHLDSKQKQRAKADVKKTFNLLDIIKEESFGSVYLFEEQGSNTLFIMKKKGAYSPGLNTAKRMVNIKHPHIVNVMGTSQNEKSFVIVMEYCSGGSLADRLVKPIDLENFYLIAEQILQGLKAANDEGIIHGNLRPANILFDQSNTVKVSDFGLEEHYGEEQDNWYNVKGEVPSEASDIFSLGVIFYQMLTAEMPRWKDERLLKNKRFAKLSEAIQVLIRRMIARNISKRIQTLSALEQGLHKIYDAQATQVRNVEKGKTRTDEVHRVEVKKSNQKTLLLILLFIFLAIVAGQVYLYSTNQLQELIEMLIKH